MTDRRSQRLARLLGDSARARGGHRRRGLRSVGLALLVLFTIWGFGRAWHGGLAPVELTIGLVAGVAAGVTSWRR